ncbi:MAG TPA: SRPBCC family protein [Nevskia sp.]|nr:SRPBCC family protein [Nevskia sp.]
MRVWTRRLARLACLALVPAAAAAEIQSLQVQHDGNRYRVDLQVKLQAPAAAAYAAFAAPGSLPAINPAVRKVQVLERGGDERARVYTEVRVCAMLYCKTLRQVQDMRYAPRPDGGALHAEVLPESSDFSYGRADWDFRPAGGATELRFSAELEPAFWIPPLLGPWLVERSLREEAERTSAGIERLARPPPPFAGSAAAREERQ